MNKTSKLKFGFRLILLFVLLALLSSVTVYAWFANNATVSVKKMTINSEVTSNLMISNTTSGISDLTTDNAKVSVSETFNANNKFLPCTHDFTNSTSTSTCLKYVANTGSVDKSTGLISEEITGGTLQYNQVTFANKSYFFVDYTVYIASAKTEPNGDTSKPSNIEMTNTTLTVSLLNSKYVTFDEEGKEKTIDDTGTAYDTFKAATIDFYVNGNYVDRLNVAGYSWYPSDASKTDKTSVTLIDNGTIPSNGASSDNYITVTMRCYYDGELLKESGTTFITTDTVTTNWATLNLKFEATENATSAE